MTTLSAKDHSNAIEPGAPSGWLARELRKAMIDPRNEDQSEATLTVTTEPDRVAAFGPVILTMRLATTAVSLMMVSSDLLAGHRTTIIACLVVLTYAMFRTFNPIRYTSDFRSMLRVVGELALHIAVVIATGGWNSPFVFSLITASAIAGFARGMRSFPICDVP